MLQLKNLNNVNKARNKKSNKETSRSVSSYFFYVIPLRTWSENSMTCMKINVKQNLGIYLV